MSAPCPHNPNRKCPCGPSFLIIPEAEFHIDQIDTLNDLLIIEESYNGIIVKPNPDKDPSDINTYPVNENFGYNTGIRIRGDNSLNTNVDELYMPFTIMKSGAQLEIVPPCPEGWF